MSLGGIVFLPVMGGITITDDCGLESLNMRVGKVVRDSPAHVQGVTSQHYLYKLRTLSDNPKGPMVADDVQRLTSSRFRNVYTNTVQLQKLCTLVESILTFAFINKKSMEVTLVYYT